MCCLLWLLLMCSLLWWIVLRCVLFMLISVMVLLFLVSCVLNSEFIVLVFRIVIFIVGGFVRMDSGVVLFVW